MFPALVAVEQADGDARDERFRSSSPPSRASKSSAITGSCARSAGAAWGSSTRPSRSRWAAAWP